MFIWLKNVFSSQTEKIYLKKKNTSKGKTQNAFDHDFHFENEYFTKLKRFFRYLIDKYFFFIIYNT